MIITGSTRTPLVLSGHVLAKLLGYFAKQVHADQQRKRRAHIGQVAGPRLTRLQVCAWDCEWWVLELDMCASGLARI
jgi:hypothetical protein